MRSFFVESCVLTRHLCNFKRNVKSSQDPEGQKDLLTYCFEKNNVDEKIKCVLDSLRLTILWRSADWPFTRNVGKLSERRKQCKQSRACSFASSLERNHAPGPAETDGEATTPGPRERNRGQRSEAARLARLLRRNHF